MIEKVEESEAGKLVIAEYASDFYEWTPNVRIVGTDFLSSDASLVLAMPADLSVWRGLAAEMMKEYGRKEFLFKQQPKEGSIVSLPPSLTETHTGKIHIISTDANERTETRSLRDLCKCTARRETFSQSTKRDRNQRTDRGSWARAFESWQSLCINLVCVC
jgi:hypothetical protein